MTSDDRYEEGTAHGRGPGARQRPEQVLGRVGWDPSEEDGRMMYLQQLRARIERGEYEVDPDAVAASIVERLDTLRERLARRRADEREHASAEVVESN